MPKVPKAQVLTKFGCASLESGSFRKNLSPNNQLLKRHSISYIYYAHLQSKPDLRQVIQVMPWNLNFVNCYIQVTVTVSPRVI